MVRYIILSVLLSSILYCSGMHYAVSDKHAFVLPKKSLEIKADYLKVNDTLDIFNLKEKQFDKLGSIGDMDGYDLEIRYGLSKQDSIFADIQRWNVDYGDSVLQNNKYILFNRYQLMKNEYSFLNALSFDVGFEQNSAEPITISSDNNLNALIGKIKPNSTTKLKDGTIISGSSTLTLYDNVGNKIYPYLMIKNLKSRSYYGKILFGKSLSKYAVFDFYLGYRYTKITTAIDFYPKGGLIDNFTKGYNIKDMNRDEKNLNVGFSYILQKRFFIYECNYEYNRLFRDADVRHEETNQIVNASISMIMSKNVLIFVGGKLMTNQFNTDIPYLYNRYTKTQFDHKYGFAKFGFVYRFN